MRERATVSRVGGQPTDEVSPVPMLTRRRLLFEGLAVRVALGVIFGGLFFALALSSDSNRANTMAAVGILGILVVVNIPYWFVGARAGFPERHQFVHRIIDIVLLTVMIHYLGGILVPYGGLAYSALVLF